MRKSTLVRIGAVVAVTGSVALGSVGPAMADVYPQANDIVGGGSDTLQYTADFMFDGTPTGLSGYNVAKANRVFSFDATGDANARAVYDDQGATGGRSPLAITSVMRAGTKPVVRPNGSGAGVAALYKGEYVTLQSGSDPNVGKFKSGVLDFARSSGLPKCSVNTEAVNAGVGGLRVIKFATEPLAMGVPVSGTNAPTTGLMTIDVIQKIYAGDILTWNQIPGNSGGSTATIIPQIPQSGSGTRSTFTGALDTAFQAAGGSGSAPLTNPNLQTVQENDYTSLTSPATGSSLNVIAPFSGGRIGLNNSGFFGSGATNQVKQLNATGDWVLNRALYYVLRQSDVSAGSGVSGVVSKAGAPFQTSSTKDFASTLFVGTGSVAQSPIYASRIAAAGHSQSYTDLGTPGVQGTSCAAG